MFAGAVKSTLRLGMLLITGLIFIVAYYGYWQMFTAVNNLSYTTIKTLCGIAGWCSSKGSSTAHFIAAINYHNQAAQISNKLCETNVTCTISPSDWDTIIGYDKKALVEAEQADIVDMNKHYPGFGDHFRDEFIHGLKMFIENDNWTTVGPFLAGQMLMDNFGDWYAKNFEAIRGKTDQR